MSVTNFTRAFDKPADRDDIWADLPHNPLDESGENTAVFASQSSPRTDATLGSRFLAGDAVDSVVVRIMSLDLVSTVILQRIYLGTSITLVTHFAALGLLAYCRRLDLSAPRFAAYLAFFGAAFASIFLSGNESSVTAIALAVVCYAGFVFVVPSNEATYIEVVKIYQWVALIACGLVFLQLVTQVVGLGMPNEDAVVPSALVAPSMNYMQHLDWRASFIKPNAIFMLEASYTCQFIAIAVVIEIAMFRRLGWLIAYALGILGTASGTGILLILLSLPFLARRFLRPLLLGGVAVAVVGVPLAVSTGWYELASKRTETFTVHGTSANSRFVGPYQNVVDIFEAGNFHDIWFGYGAGAIGNSQANPNLDVFEYSAIPKVFLEYGFPATVIFILYITYLFFGTGVPFIIAWALTLEYYLMGGHFALPPILNYCFILCAGWKFIRLPHAKRFALRKVQHSAEIVQVEPTTI